MSDLMLKVGHDAAFKMEMFALLSECHHHQRVPMSTLSGLRVITLSRQLSQSEPGTEAVDQSELR